MGYFKSSSKREVCSNKGLPQETRKISDKQSNLIPKGSRKRRRNETLSQYKEGNNKDQSRTMKYRCKKAIEKGQ